MMIAPLLLAPMPVPMPVPAPMPASQEAPLQTRTINWDALASLPYRAVPVVTADMLGFVANEAATRKCPVPVGPGQVLTIDVAVLIDPEGNVRTTIPRAIRCATVEQYAAALVAGFARNNLLPRTADADQWYRANITFAWPK